MRMGDKTTKKIEKSLSSTNLSTNLTNLSNCSIPRKSAPEELLQNFDQSYA